MMSLRKSDFTAKLFCWPTDMRDSITQLLCSVKQSRTRLAAGSSFNALNDLHTFASSHFTLLMGDFFFSVHLCVCVFFTVIVHSAQLRMFDLNGDGKLGLSEMARWVCLLAFLSLCLVLSRRTFESFNLADEKESFLSFYRRLLPVHENFLLKFEVRFKFDWFSCTSSNCSLVTVMYTQNSIVQHYWIIYKWTTDTNVVYSLCFSPSGFK